MTGVHTTSELITENLKPLSFGKWNTFLNLDSVSFALSKILVVYVFEKDAVLLRP